MSFKLIYLKTCCCGYLFQFISDFVNYMLLLSEKWLSVDADYDDKMLKHLLRIMKMKDKILSTGILFFTCLGAAQSAIAYEIVCPKSVTVIYAKPDLKQVPEGWDVSEKKQDLISLSGVGVYSGKPVDLAVLKPNPVIINGQKQQLGWQVNREYDNPYGGNWVGCSYNYYEVELTRQIDRSMKTCWAVYSQDKYQATLAKLVCSTEVVE
ncbi:STY0301 family protein [Snodgrassella sp. ESL0253]|uniref:STY0301 family protein n=1 Tax=Snodgrassella sp. ESL0253 TaxID=2705031 RepID=UPI001581BB1D|nr:STY0301 family protein [Snodgrassella sp. ESL0253]NUE65685.1 hypothetical protein [Snodgrassella sp. ESL0253]